MRGTGIFITLLMPLLAVAQVWDEAYVEELYRGRVLDPIEGVWKFPKDAATIAITKSQSDTYDIYILDSPRLDIKPGTLIGSAVSTPTKNVYDGKLESKRLGKKHKLSSQTVTFTVNDNGALVIKPYKTGYSLSFNRWLSYIFRVRIIENNKRPQGLDGAKRIYPYFITDHLPVCL